MIDLYNAYIERWKQEHPNIVQPQTHIVYPFSVQSMPDGIEPYWVPDKGDILHHASKYWQDFGKVIKMRDSGKVYEVVEKDQPMRTLIAVFATEAQWRAYDSPMTITQYFDQW
jgi:hypothetical protein